MRKVVVTVMSLAVLGLIFIFLKLHSGIPTIPPELTHSARELKAQHIQVTFLLYIVPAVLMLAFAYAEIKVLKQLSLAVGQRFISVRRKYFLVSLFVIATASSAYINFRYLHQSPQIVDSQNYYFQARVFAQGGLWVPSYPYMEDFFGFMAIIDQDGKRYGSSFPGHPFLLMLGELVGLAWLINPVQGGLIIVLLYLLGVQLFSEGVGRIAALLATFSPFRIFQCALHMAHPSATLWILVLVWLLFRYFGKPTVRQAFFIGGIAGLLYLIRPQSAFPLLLPFAGTYLYRLVRKRVPVAQVIAITAPLLCFLGSSLWYNKVLTGDCYVSPRDMAAQSLRLGFGDDVGRPLGPGKFSGHSVRQGLANTFTNLKLLSRETLCWGGWTVILCLLPLFHSGPERLRAFQFILSGLLLMSIYFAYPINSPLFGPRYYFEWFPFYLLLIVQGMHLLRMWIKTIKRTLWGSILDQTTSAPLVVTLFLLAAFVFVVPSQINRYFGNIAPNYLHKVTQETDLQQSIVFVRGDYFLQAYSFAMNDPQLKKTVLYASDRGHERNITLRTIFPDHRFYYYQKPDHGSGPGSLKPFE